MNEIKITSARRWAEDKGLSHSHVRNKLRWGQIRGAVKIGRDWWIPVGEKTIDKEKLLTTDFVAKISVISQSHMRRVLRDGKYKGSKVFRDWIISDLNQPRYLRLRKKKKPCGDKLTG